MRFEIAAVNHVCLVVRDIAAAEKFYVDILGLERHHKISSWFVLNRQSTLHLIGIPDAAIDDSLYHELQHVAFQVPDLRVVLRLLLENQLEPFQMDFEGEQQRLLTPEDRLDFGIGTLFVYDPDGNLIEFVEIGKGIYTEDMQPQVT